MNGIFFPAFSPVRFFFLKYVFFSGTVFAKLKSRCNPSRVTLSLLSSSTCAKNRNEVSKEAMTSIPKKRIKKIFLLKIVIMTSLRRQPNVVIPSVFVSLFIAVEFDLDLGLCSTSANASVSCDKCFFKMLDTRIGFSHGMPNTPFTVNRERTFQIFLRRNASSWHGYPKLMFREKGETYVFVHEGVTSCVTRCYVAGGTVKNLNPT